MSTLNWPEPQTVWKAIEIYLQAAYPGGTPPAAVRGRLDTLHTCEGAAIFESSLFERRGEGDRIQLLLRLGNRCYPHMKLVIEQRPDHNGCLFRADTHDAHCCPAAGTLEFDAFRALMEANRDIASAVESQWELRGIPTFKTYLKQDLARRMNKAKESSRPI